MRKIPGVPELSGPGYRQPITDGVAIYRGRHAGHSPIDWAREFVGAGYHWRGFNIPDSSNQSIPARGTFEDQVSLAPGSFLLSIASRSSQAAGFQFQVTDVARRETLSQGGYCLAGVESGRPGKFPGRGGPFWLGSPWAVGGVVLVQIVNLATVANTIDLYLQFAEPNQS